MSNDKSKKVQYIEFADGAINPLLRIKKEKKDHRVSLQRTKPTIVPIHPTGDLLTRVSAFLPVLAQANKDLEGELDKSRFKMELPSDQDDDHEGRVIEMNIGIGVLEETKDEGKRDDIRIWIDDDISSDSDQSKG